MKHPVGWPLLIALIALACVDSDAVIFAPTDAGAVHVGSGLYRVTFNRGDDMVRGFSADGDRIVYRGYGLLGEEWRMYSIAVDGGAAREEVPLYRKALTDPIASLAERPGDRVITIWKPTVAGLSSGCGGGCPGQTVYQFRLLTLDRSDGLPLSGLQSRTITTPTITGNFTLSQRVRITPAEREVTSSGTNPFGPALVRDSTTGYYSDGDVIYWFDAADTTIVPDSIAPGSFPAVSSDGSILAYSRPTGLDSTVSSCSAILGLTVCNQTTVTITYTGWETVVFRLGEADTILVVPGIEPVFDPSRDRILVRRPEGFVFVSLTDQSELPVSGTTGALSPAISGDGEAVAFSMQVDGNLDVYFVLIDSISAGAVQPASHRLSPYWTTASFSSSCVPFHVKHVAWSFTAASEMPIFDN